MFERYTEKARRAIFFARYEASQHGTPYIETPSLLLGILKEDSDIRARLLRTGMDKYARLCADVEALFPESSAEISTSVDLPLSQVAVRALTCAAEEAERRHHKFIEPLHLLWGLLTASGPETDCLKSHGITLEAVNQDLARLPGENDRRAFLLRRALDAIPEDRLAAAATLLDGLVSGSFEVTGTSRNGPFHFSFDDKPK